MSKELGNAFIFVRFGYMQDSPIGAYTLNVKEVSLTGATIDNIEEKKKAIENGEDIKITFTCNKVELVSPDRIIEYAFDKEKADKLNAYTVDEMIKDIEDAVHYWDEQSNKSDSQVFQEYKQFAPMYHNFIEYAKILKGEWEKRNGQNDKP